MVDDVMVVHSVFVYLYNLDEYTYVLFVFVDMAVWLDSYIYSFVHVTSENTVMFSDHTVMFSDHYVLLS